MGEVLAARYELVDPIGRGGAGEVWRAWDLRRGRYVAVKVLQQSDAHTLLRFVREQAVRIDHPHVLAPTGWAADDDQVLFAMDLVAGGSLSHLIADHGPLPPRFVCRLLDQLLAGLQAVHDEDIIHRDIKPANILLEATGTGRPRLRLSDFGISMRKGEARLTETNFVVGTPGYFAPEQLLGADPDTRADLYAVGLVALYLLTGAKPDSVALTDAYHAERGVPDAPALVPEPLWGVLGTLLNPDPVARFRTATGVRKALAAAVELLPGEEATRARQPVEIGDQLGPLPPGYGPRGPVAATDATDATDAGDAGDGRHEESTDSYRIRPPAPPVPRPDQAPTAGATRSPGRAAPSPPPPPSTAPPTAAVPPTIGPPTIGPPAKIAIPVLMVALLSIGLGIWALATA
ncbi:serine/threonine-protein kinase [Streptomyces xiamenensis]